MVHEVKFKSAVMNLLRRAKKSYVVVKKMFIDPQHLMPVYGVLATAIVGLLYAFYLVITIGKEEEGSQKMLEVANSIKEGANAYLKRQLKSIAFFIILLAIFLYFTWIQPTPAGYIDIGIGRSIAFLMGSTFSATVGYVGMNMGVRGNLKVAAKAEKHDFIGALRVAYRSGTITGMLTDGLGLLGGTLLFLIWQEYAYDVLLGFGFGGTLIALFMRVGGGIYTKAADVGADLVGKVEKGIPEDDPRNAAVIADQVGDQVGDNAGMAADIFESYEVTIVSAMILGWSALGAAGVVFPLLVRAIGVLSSIIGTYAVRAKGRLENAMRAIERGFLLSAAISIIGFMIVSWWYMGDLRYGYATLSGVILAVVINRITEHFTGTDREPVKGIARSTQTGSATTILRGIAVGYEATVWAIMAIVGSIIASIFIFLNEFTANPIFVFYGVSLTGIGMLTLTGNNISMDAFGPISDNAQGIAEMSGLDEEARSIVEDLDAVGNTTKAITKGIAIGSAVIAAVSLFWSFLEDVGKVLVANGQPADSLNLSLVNPFVFIGLLIGGAIPWLFSSLAIRAVERAASTIIYEVRRQFKENPDIMAGKAKPDYARVVDICTASAQKELVSLALLAILTPIAVGFLLDETALAGFLAGAILSGQLLAVFMASAGGAWDNAKKIVEKGEYGGKGSYAHKASIVGDTVGDPLKDTAGPALNPMIKVINLISLIVAPMVVVYRLNPPMIGTIPVIPIAMIVVLALIFAAIWYSKKDLPYEIEAVEADASEAV